MTKEPELTSISAAASIILITSERPLPSRLVRTGFSGILKSVSVCVYVRLSLSLSSSKFRWSRALEEATLFPNERKPVLEKLKLNNTKT